MWYRSSESRQPCLIPGPRGKAFSFSLLRMMLAVGFSYMAFIMLWYIPRISIVERFFFFFIKGCQISSNVRWSYESILHVVNSVYHIDLLLLNHPYIPGIDPVWSWCMILLMYCWTHVANSLLRIFASMFLRDIGLYFFFSFSCSTLVWLW